MRESGSVNQSPLELDVQIRAKNLAGHKLTVKFNSADAFAGNYLRRVRAVGISRMLEGIDRAILEEFLLRFDPESPDAAFSPAGNPLICAGRAELAEAIGYSESPTWAGMLRLASLGIIRVSVKGGGKSKPNTYELLPPLSQAPEEVQTSQLGLFLGDPEADGKRSVNNSQRALDPLEMETKRSVDVPTARFGGVEDEAKRSVDAGVEDSKARCEGLNSALCDEEGVKNEVKTASKRAVNVSTARFAAAEATHDHDHEFIENHDHDHESQANRRQLLRSIRCVFPDQKEKLDENGIRKLLRSPKCTAQNIRWASRHLAIKAEEMAEAKKPFVPMAYVYRLIQNGCVEPPTDQERCHQVPDRPRIPDAPGVAAADLAAMRKQAEKMTPEQSMALWKTKADTRSSIQPISASLVMPPESSVQATGQVEESPDLTEAEQSEILRAMTVEVRSELVAKVLLQWKQEQRDSWERGGIQPLQVPGVRNAVCKLALSIRSKRGG